MKSIDINCDMGEIAPGKTENYDHLIMPFVSSCNVSCGFHSGTPYIIEKTIAKAIEHGVKIGAHPSYRDHANFGRLSLDVPDAELKAQLRYQVGAIKGMVESLGGKLHHVKPHGALYNDMAKNRNLANLVVSVVKAIDSNLNIYGLSGSVVAEVCQEHHMKFVQEAFADRKYEANRQLRSRKLQGAVLEDSQAVLRQLAQLLDGQVETYEGEIINLDVDTICLHSDMENAVHLAEEIYNYLMNKKVSIGHGKN